MKHSLLKFRRAPKAPVISIAPSTGDTSPPKRPPTNNIHTLNNEVRPKKNGPVAEYDKRFLAIMKSLLILVISVSCGTAFFYVEVMPSWLRGSVFLAFFAFGVKQANRYCNWFNIIDDNLALKNTLKIITDRFPKISPKEASELSAKHVGKETKRFDLFSRILNKILGQKTGDDK